MVNDLDLDDDDLVTTHETLRSIKEMFEEAASGDSTQESETLDDAMWYVEEQMSEDLQDEYSADQ